MYRSIDDPNQTFLPEIDIDLGGESLGGHAVNHEVAKSLTRRR
jgi:hypothetical protein